MNYKCDKYQYLKFLVHRYIDGFSASLSKGDE